MSNPVKPVRRTVQLAALLVFLALVARTHWTPTGSAQAPVFLRMDPLAALVTWLAPTPTWLPLFLPALGLLVATAVLGRFFCGWICPLGTVIDGSDHLLAAGRRPSRRWSQPALKLYILGFVLAAAVFGTQVAWLADPIPLLTRVAVTVAYPVVAAAYNLGVTTARPFLLDLHWRLSPMENAPTFALNLAVLAGFAGILALGLLGRRTWCRNLCPLGALLGLVGRLGLWRRRVTGCVSCRRCAAACKMAAVVVDPEDEPTDYSRTATSECIQCYDCLVCPQPGIAGMTLSRPHGETDEVVQVSKRHFLGALALGAVYGMVAATGAGRRTTNARLLRPPGALMRTGAGFHPMTENQFRDLCLRCGNCMKACITGGLQPAVVEAGFDGVFTPILVPRIGHCEQDCTACGQVCPSGALGPFRVDEKSRIRIGLATIHTNKCLSWRHGEHYRLCLMCAEHCPYGAVEVIESKGERRPVANADKCVGCGQCERVCPCKPEAAIVVYRRETYH
jgi:ferredoxin